MIKAKPHLLALAAVVVLAVSCGRQSGPTSEQAKNEPAAAPQQAAPPAAAGQPAAAPAPEQAAQPKPETAPAARPVPAPPAAAPPQTAAQAPAPAPAPPPKPKTAVIPAGTTIAIRTIEPISTKTATAGSTFTATLVEPIVRDGLVIAPRGANVVGRVTDSDPGGRVSGRARISVRLASIAGAGGQRIPVATNAVTQEAKSTKGRDVKRGAIATGVGAAIGAIAGGGKGAAIGAGVGAGAGVGVAAATRGDPAVIPSETILRFQLASPVTFTEKPKAR